MRICQLVTILLTCCALSQTTAHAKQPITPELLEQIRQSSIDYHQKLRTYECTYTEILRSLSKNIHQKSQKRIVEDALGQIRLESDIQ